MRLVDVAGRKLLESGGGCVGADEVVTMRQASDSFAVETFYRGMW